MGNMATSQDIRSELMLAVDHAMAGRWDAAHAIAQSHEDSPLACWLHAVLHKIEGDKGYARTHVDYERFADPNVELRAILHELTRNT